MDFIDLHCHWISGIDDGPRAVAAGIDVLRRLAEVGFSTVIATPHMRPGMFENDSVALREAYDRMAPHLDEARGRGIRLPAVGLSSEHWFDDVVFRRLIAGEALPYPGGGAVLVEWNPQAFPNQIAHRLFDLKRKGLTAVIAHPERYQPVWKDDSCLDPILDAGALLLLDVCSLVGKYGRASQKAAESLVEDEAYEAACSDTHKPEDVADVAKAIDRLRTLVGPVETNRLFVDAPRAILRTGTDRPASKQATHRA